MNLCYFTLCIGNAVKTVEGVDNPTVCYTGVEAAALIAFDETLLLRMLSSEGAAELTTVVHEAIIELAQPGGKQDPRLLKKETGFHEVRGIPRCSFALSDVDARLLSA